MTQEEIDASNQKAYEDRTLDMIRSRNAAIAELERQHAIMRGALLVISEWKLPFKGFSWERGSNGERDHFRSVAKIALDGNQ